MQRISDDDFARTKFFKIAQEMNKGWIVDFSVTHKAYKDEREALILINLRSSPSRNGKK